VPDAEPGSAGVFSMRPRRHRNTSASWPM
jgi:hypothetical protein